MSQTWNLLKLKFGVVAGIIFAYFLPRKINDKYMAIDGYYEAHNRIANKEVGLMAASAGGHLEMVKLMISRGATNFGGALRYAWENGHHQVAEYLIALGIELWDHPLRAACRLGDRKLIDLCLSNTIMNWTPAVYGACRNGDLSLFREMYDNISLGRNEIDPVLIRNAIKGGNIEILYILVQDASIAVIQYVMEIACGYGNRHIVELLSAINPYAKINWNKGLLQACDIGNIHGINLAIENGATDLSNAIGRAIYKNRTIATQRMIARGAYVDNMSLWGVKIYDMEFAMVMIPPEWLEHFLEKARQDNQPEIMCIISKRIKMRDHLSSLGAQ